MPFRKHLSILATSSHYQVSDAIVVELVVKEDSAAVVWESKSLNFYLNALG